MNNSALSHSAIAQQLLSSLSDVLESANRIRKLAIDEMDTYPVYAPTFGANNKDHTSREARLAALNSITRIFKNLKNEEDLLSGILYVSDQLAHQLDIFNNTKITFNHLATKAHRLLSVSLSYNSGKLISGLLKNELKMNPNIEGLELKSIEDIAYKQIDLKACRTKIRILPKNLDMLRWTWATNHKRIEKVTKEVALELANRLSGDSLQDAIKSIQSCPDSFFAKVTPLNEQLRANYVCYEDGSRINKSTPISGIVVVPQTTLPRLLWRDPPSQRSDISPRLQRESSIQEIPIVSALNLHRYK